MALENEMEVIKMAQMNAFHTNNDMLQKNTITYSKMLEMNHSTLQVRGLMPIVQPDINEGIGLSLAGRATPDGQVSSAFTNGLLMNQLGNFRGSNDS